MPAVVSPSFDRWLSSALVEPKLMDTIDPKPAAKVTILARSDCPEKFVVVTMCPNFLELSEIVPVVIASHCVACLSHCLQTKSIHEFSWGKSIQLSMLACTGLLIGWISRIFPVAYYICPLKRMTQMMPARLLQIYHYVMSALGKRELSSRPQSTAKHANRRSVNNIWRSALYCLILCSCTCNVHSSTRLVCIRQ